MFDADAYFELNDAIQLLVRAVLHKYKLYLVAVKPTYKDLFRLLSGKCLRCQFNVIVGFVANNDKTALTFAFLAMLVDLTGDSLGVLALYFGDTVHDKIVWAFVDEISLTEERNLDGVGILVFRDERLDDELVRERILQCHLDLSFDALFY